MADLDPTETDGPKQDTKPKRRRVKSAVARLSPLPENQSDHLQDELKVIQKEFKQRTTSAQNIRKKHTSSRKVISGGKGPEKQDRFKTMYSADFRGKYVTPPECRPTSPTRRHNPHPSRVSNVQSCISTGYNGLCLDCYHALYTILEFFNLESAHQGINFTTNRGLCR